MKARHLHHLLLPLLLASQIAVAWEVKVAPDSQGDGNDEWVWVANESDEVVADGYLVWADLDQPATLSWSFSDGWKRGVSPISATPLSITPFTETRLAPLPASCPAGHRCLMIMVANTPGAEPTDSSGWLLSSIQPLTPEAEQGRWPGQSSFATLDEDGGAYRYEPTYSPAMEGDDGMVADSAASESGAGSPPAETEKPDLFRREGDRLLYANGAAERLQVINVADRANPQIEGELALEGAPREIYAIDDNYLLLEGRGWDAASATRVVAAKRSEDGTLRVTGELEISGHFVESRRRNQRIYVVTEDYNSDSQMSEVTIHPVTLGDNGVPLAAAPSTFAGYSPHIAIFPDHLVIAASSNLDWRSTRVQLYDLSSEQQPLTPFTELTVDGRIPSEFHLNVRDGQLRVVHGPADREAGSTLSIYDLSGDSLKLLGEVGEIAPGEALFATRFVDQTAYVVTFERTDPLWVIDLSVATAPVIVGELHVPGWSELLFFNQQRLLGVGIDDQPAEGERIDGVPVEWARRVAVSLFDVTQPTEPTLIERFTPLVGIASYSHSPALDDERALRLDWEGGEVALPISHWQDGNHHMLQLITINDDGLDDGGAIKTATPIQRSVVLDSDHLAVLGDQALYTARRDAQGVTTIGEIELARSLDWLHLFNQRIYATGYGENGYHRLYLLDSLANSTTVDRVWQIGGDYQKVTAANNKILFYKEYPFSGELIDLASGEQRRVTAEQKQEDGWSHGELFDGESLYMTRTTYHYDQMPKPLPEPIEPDSGDREQPAGTKPAADDSVAVFSMDEGGGVSGSDIHRTSMPYDDGGYYPDEPYIYRERVTNQLVGWRIDGERLAPYPPRSIPGSAVSVRNGTLHTIEWADNGGWLHRLGLQGARAVLLDSTPISGCNGFPSGWATSGDQLWVSCATTIDGSDQQYGTRLTAYTLTSSPRPLRGFTLEGEWSAIEATPSHAILAGHTYSPYRPMPIDDVEVMDGVAADMIWMPPGCGVVDLASGELTEIDSGSNGCYSAGAVELVNGELLKASGYAGIKRWPVE